jgi:uncharacterized membrane protein YfcA
VTHLFGYTSLGEWLLASAVVMTGAALQGSAGFGFALLSSPILGLVDPSLVPAPLIIAVTLLLALTAWRERSAVDLRGLGWVLGGRLPGTVLGALALKVLSERALTTALGLLVLFAVAISLRSVRLERRPPLLVAAGVVSGLMGTTAALGGPAVAVLYQHERGALVRSTLATYFLVGAAMSLTALAIVGRLGPREFALALGLLPGIALGFLSSRWTSRWLDGGYTRVAVLLIAGIAGLGSVIHGLV